MRVRFASQRYCRKERNREGECVCAGMGQKSRLKIVSRKTPLQRVSRHFSVRVFIDDDDTCFSRGRSRTYLVVYFCVCPSQHIRYGRNARDLFAFNSQITFLLLQSGKVSRSSVRKINTDVVLPLNGVFVACKAGENQKKRESERLVRVRLLASNVSSCDAKISVK